MSSSLLLVFVVTSRKLHVHDSSSYLDSPLHNSQYWNKMRNLTQKSIDSVSALLPEVSFHILLEAFSFEEANLE